MYKNGKIENTAVVDLFLGDSGKGKIVDYLASQFKSVVRFNGANNAGHTLSVNNEEHKTHAVPSGVLHSHVTNYIGHGCCIDPSVLNSEIERYKQYGSSIYISGQAHMILPGHIERDISNEKKNKVGSTKRGVSPAYTDKAARLGLRYQDLLLDSKSFYKRVEQLGVDPKMFSQLNIFEGPGRAFVHDPLSMKLKPYIVEDGVSFMQSLLQKGPVLFEGAQGCFLDIDVGEYPYVTSSNCTIGSVFTGTGTNWQQLDEVIGVIKAYGSYVGTNSNFCDIADEELNAELSQLGKEFGATTGRKRRLCWLDLDMISKAAQINGPTKLAITKMDILGQMSKVFIKSDNQLVEFLPWGDLSNTSNMGNMPLEAKNFLDFIENKLKTPIWAVGTGPDRHDLIFMEGDD